MGNSDSAIHKNEFRSDIVLPPVKPLIQNQDQTSIINSNNTRANKKASKALKSIASRGTLQSETNISHPGLEDEEDPHMPLEQVDENSDYYEDSEDIQQNGVLYSIGQICMQRMSQEEITRVKEEYGRLSRDNVIGKRKLLEYFRITELQDMHISTELFQMIKNSSKINRPINFNKFFNFIAIISKGNKEEKLQLLYTFFDKGLNAKITKEDLKSHISGTILSMQGIKFDMQEVENLKSQIAIQTDNDIDAALDIMVDEIFASVKGNHEELSFEEWKAWFLKQDGVELVLNPHNLGSLTGGHTLSESLDVPKYIQFKV